MSAAQQKRRYQLREARLEIVSQMYKRGHSIRAIRAEVMRRLDLDTYSTSTVHKDVGILLSEWRENRFKNIDDTLQLELERIDDTVKELWEQWEKSKLDFTLKNTAKKGNPKATGEGGKIETTLIEEESKQVIGLGDVAYITEMRKQLMERRKLLGLYAPEKRDIQGSMSFASFLMESGIIDEDEDSKELD